MAHPMAALLVCALTVISLWGHGVSGSAKSEFLQRLKAETRGELGSLSTATAQNEYADYVERFGKLSGYMASDFDVKAHYAAYQENAAEIVRLNAAAQHEDEHYSINAFTDMTMEEKMAMLIPLEEFASRRRMGWDDVDCITVSPRSLPTDASRRSDTEMARNACGRVKSQGRLGSCWAFASTGQLQCNYNEEMAGNKVFSEKYATDCSDDSIGTVNGGGLQNKLTEWYDDNGACASFHKRYDGYDNTEYNGDCGCRERKSYGQCYALYAHSDGGIIAAAATEHAYDFGIGLCSSFWSAAGTWYGCGRGERVLGGHAMTIVGQQYGEKILVRNSWGTGWGMVGTSLAGHVWFDKSVWSTAAGQFNSLPITRTQFRSDRRGQIPSAFDAVDTDKWTLTLSGKDMAILVLMAINAVIIVAACCQSARSRSRRYGKGKYEVVAVAAHSDLEDAALRQ